MKKAFVLNWLVRPLFKAKSSVILQGEQSNDAVILTSHLMKTLFAQIDTLG